jgi:hypothetical protein
MTEIIPDHALSILRRADREISDLMLQAKTIERFASVELSALSLKEGDSIDLEAGVVTRKAPAVE